VPFHTLDRIRSAFSTTAVTPVAPVEFMHRVEYRTKGSGEPWVKYFDTLPGQDIEQLKTKLREWRELKTDTEWRIVRRPVGEWEEVEL